jgi:hypothetical protein
MLEEQMRLYYHDVATAKKATFKTNRVKSHLIESHMSDSTPDGIAQRLRSLITQDAKGTDTVRIINVETTQDDRLFVLTGASPKTDYVSRFYVDAADTRYWVVHSLDKSSVVRPKMTSLAAALGRGFDNVWFTVEMLAGSSRFGERRGVKVRFADYLRPSVRDDDEPHADVFKMELRSADVEEQLAFLNDAIGSPFSSRVALSASIIRTEDDDDSSRFVLEDIYHNGHFSARGTSSAHHLDVVQGMKRTYANFIKDLEENRAVSWRGDRHSGEVMLVTFQRPDIDAARLVAVLCSGRAPFNFWGVPVRIRDGHWRADLVDLHQGNAGHMLQIEVSPRWLRLKLLEGGCGNAVTRLISQLQHGVDSRAALVLAGGEVPVA